MRLLVMHGNGPRVVLLVVLVWMLRVVGWRWQALRRVGVMLGGASVSNVVGSDSSTREKRETRGNNDKQIGGREYEKPECWRGCGGRGRG